MPSLAHYGVKGMKWGVRKDKNPNSRKAKRAEAKKLSNEELGDRLKRLRMEDEYVRLTAQTSKLEKGGKFVADLVTNTGKQILVSQVSKRANNYVNDIFK